jgi:hypothetical protein
LTNFFTKFFKNNNIDKFLYQVLPEPQLPEISAPDLLAHPEVGPDHQDGAGTTRSGPGLRHVAGSTGTRWREKINFYFLVFLTVLCLVFDRA